MQQGEILYLSLDSRAVGRPMPVWIVTPPGYADDASAVYPVLYFLHPWELSPRYITDKLNIHLHLWHGIADGTLPPMVIVLPSGEKSFFLNAADPPGHDWSSVIALHADFFRDALDQYGCYGDYLLAEVILMLRLTSVSALIGPGGQSGGSRWAARRQRFTRFARRRSSARWAFTVPRCSADRRAMVAHPGFLA